MKKFIVTGATGFVASNLTRKLVNENHEVHLICRENSDLTNIEDILDKVNIFRYDFKIENLIEFFNKVKPDGVFHLASLFIAQHNENDVDNLINSNLKFSTQILEAMNKSGVKNIVNTGTAWQHYNNKDYDPVCLYAATKKAFEDILEFYVNAYNFKAITLSLFDTYGETDRRSKLINMLRTISKENKELSMAPGDQKIDLTHIDDVVDAFCVAFSQLEKMEEPKHECYAVCTQRRVTLKELISIYEKENNVELKVNWGAREYRFREVMEPWSNYTLLPNWKSKITLEEGVRRIGGLDNV